jgi:thiamine biosynthesis lipoprotein
MRESALYTVLALLLLQLGGCYPDRPVYTDRFLAFGTLVDITIVGASQQQAQEAARAVEEDFLKMHEAWHAWNPGPLGRTNEQLAIGIQFPAPPMILPLVKSGQALSARSRHLFNPAVGQLIDAWGFHDDNPEGHQPPPDAMIQELVLNNPRMSDIRIEGINLQSSNPSVKLDFGAFGKGYGIDLAVKHLKELGIKNAILNTGGDLRAFGSRNGIPWNIAIRRPDGAGVIATTKVSGDESIFTSGDYERYFSWRGKRYHHIIDPRTGYPAEGTRSVTVIHPDSTTADAAATALFVAGPDMWHEIARDMGIEFVMLIDAAGAIHMSPEMEQRLELLDTDRKTIISPPMTGSGTRGS